MSRQRFSTQQLRVLTSGRKDKQIDSTVKRPAAAGSNPGAAPTGQSDSLAARPGAGIVREPSERQAAVGLGEEELGIAVAGMATERAREG